MYAWCPPTQPRTVVSALTQEQQVSRLWGQFLLSTQLQPVVFSVQALGGGDWTSCCLSARLPSQGATASVLPPELDPTPGRAALQHTAPGGHSKRTSGQRLPWGDEVTQKEADLTRKKISTLNF
jgi:hypothetical protein